MHVAHCSVLPMLQALQISKDLVSEYLSGGYPQNGGDFSLYPLLRLQHRRPHHGALKPIGLLKTKVKSYDSHVLDFRSG
jgi:hypothetical protein